MDRYACFYLSAHSIVSALYDIIITEKSKEGRLMKQKYYLALSTEEWRLLIHCLNNFRNRLISEGRYTDAVDEVLVKVANAKVKKFRVAERRG